MTRRDALVRAILGRPRTLPDPGAVDLGPFWTSFDRDAPLHLRAGFGAAQVLLCSVLPRRLGYLRGLAALPVADRERVLGHAAASPVLAPVLEVAKVVACFAYFEDADVDRAVREGRS
jgi:hypothetical protein